jgi:hypothetical protein
MRARGGGWTWTVSGKRIGGIHGIDGMKAINRFRSSIHPTDIDAVQKDRRVALESQIGDPVRAAERSALGCCGIGWLGRRIRRISGWRRWRCTDRQASRRRPRLVAIGVLNGASRNGRCAVGLLVAAVAEWCDARRRPGGAGAVGGARRLSEGFEGIAASAVQ